LQADRYAHDLLTKAGYSPKDFADAMRRLEAMEACYEIRSRKQKVNNPFAGLFGDEEEEKIGVDETGEDSKATKEKRKSERIRRDQRRVCENDLDSFLKDHVLEVEILKKAERKPTGYLSSHPETHERIEAADPASKPMP
jgi:Zn-dependent protease with chaperone function